MDNPVYGAQVLNEVPNPLYGSKQNEPSVEGDTNSFQPSDSHYECVNMEEDNPLHINGSFGESKSAKCVFSEDENYAECKSTKDDSLFHEKQT